MPCLKSRRDPTIKTVSIDGKKRPRSAHEERKEGALISGAEMIRSSKSSNTSAHHPDDESEENEAKRPPRNTQRIYIKYKIKQKGTATKARVFSALFVKAALFWDPKRIRRVPTPRCMYCVIVVVVPYPCVYKNNVDIPERTSSCKNLTTETLNPNHFDLPMCLTFSFTRNALVQTALLYHRESGPVRASSACEDLLLYHRELLLRAKTTLR